MTSESISIFWFRRDLRLHDNTALNQALKSGKPVLTIFIFDNEIIEGLAEDDSRLNFIYSKLSSLNNKLKAYGSSLKVFKGQVHDVWKCLLRDYDVSGVYINRDYEPYARERDLRLEKLLKSNDISLNTFKDHVIFEPDEVLKDDGMPYTVFTPYKKKWLKTYDRVTTNDLENSAAFYKAIYDFPTKYSLGIKDTDVCVPVYDLDVISSYADFRDYPAVKGTTRLGPYLRFGVLSIRSLLLMKGEESETFTSEIIWREFFIQILYHFPHVVTRNFKSKYDRVKWINNIREFELWKKGMTGYPIVDAGMRELNETGYMHNRVRMLTAGFLCKHLLIDWRWGEAYFASKLIDYELASNNGNWQWATGTGCDAAPYFRIFNPMTQAKTFDSQLESINTWIPELNTFEYPKPIVVHEMARERALNAYKLALSF